MKLRIKLALTVLLLTFAFGTVVNSLLAHAREQIIEENAIAMITERLNSSTRSQCEQAPAQWLQTRSLRHFHREPRRPRPRQPRQQRQQRQFYIYDENFVSQDANAPILPSRAMRRVKNRGVGTGRIENNCHNCRDLEIILVSAGWETGSCAYGAMVRPLPKPSFLAPSPMYVSSGIALFSGLIAWFAAGMIVRRVRKLKQLVDQKGNISLSGKDELSSLAEAFANNQKLLAQETEQVKKQHEILRKYVRNTSHDLLTPLTVLQGHLVAIESSKEKIKTKKLLKDAKEQCDYITSLVDNLHVQAKLAAKETTPFALINLTKLLTRVVRRHDLLARQRNIEVGISVPEKTIWITGDLTILEQAFGNPLQNAILYNQPNGHVAVILARKAEEFFLEIIDDGPGIPDKLQKLVFKRGFRGPIAENAHSSGNGLGLDITKTAIEQHGFSITIHSPKTGGTKIVIQGQIKV